MKQEILDAINTAHKEATGSFKDLNKTIEEDTNKVPNNIEKINLNVKKEENKDIGVSFVNSENIKKENNQIDMSITNTNTNVNVNLINEQNKETQEIEVTSQNKISLK